MKGRKISLEDRGPDAPKLGRKPSVSNETEKRAVFLTLPLGTLERLAKKFGSTSVTANVRAAILKAIQ
jgi:hypothetical protein